MLTLHSSVTRTPRSTSIPRADVPIPHDASLRSLCRWTHRLAPHGIQLRLFAQNVAPAAHGLVHPYPIGILESAALDAFLKLARLEGIIPALESAHAIAGAIERAPKMSPDELIIVNLSGRGDKDVAQVADRVTLD